ncbi:MAG: hypothetical protein SPH08_06260, partial [Sodaliphilus sp.]|nr:hypothetical protein [Sodaliphilus sp.]
MKALRFIMMVLLMALTANFAPQAGAQTIRDANHHNIGRISPNGTVRDNDSRPIGFFDRDGVIRNKNSMLFLLRITPSRSKNPIG